MGSYLSFRKGYDVEIKHLCSPSIYKYNLYILSALWFNEVYNIINVKNMLVMFHIIIWGQRRYFSALKQAMKLKFSHFHFLMT